MKNLISLEEFLHENFNQKTFIARKSNHIQDDIKRNWSSWNFGEEGFVGTYDDLQKYLNKSTDTKPVWISGFDIYPDQINDFQFGELYKNYWVAIDNVNARNGLSGILLNSNNIKDAIEEAETRSDYFGDGISFDANDYQLVYSNDDIHIFEEK